MHWIFVLNAVGMVILVVGLSMSLPLSFALFYQDTSVLPLLESMFAACLLGFGLHFFCRRAKVASVTHKMGMLIVTLGWLAAGFCGALPYWLGDFMNPTNAVFESFSGFTTTGASVLTDIESLPRGLLMWRSLTHWLGGMGIILLSLAILPFLGVGGMQLYKAEVPGPVPDKLRPRIKDTAKTLWKVYLLLSVAEAVLLFAGGMDVFDSICHTFGTMATGGFSTKNTSIAYFDSAYIDTVITVFMFLAGTNFFLHFQLLRGRPQSFWRDPEFRFFFVVVFVFITVCTFFVMGINYSDFWTALRYSAFQIVSIITTTGYATADYELWPAVIQAILLACMFIGGCAGSTGGGIKSMRIMILLKSGYREMFRVIHPRAVRPIKMGKRIIKEDVLHGVWGYFILYLLLFVLAWFITSAMGLDTITAFAAVLACVSNIGPGIADVGPTDNYGFVPDEAKWVLVLCMVMGRLEIYTVMALLIPEFWKK
ncbi:MAG: TrkH family potassium uptake protein [Thermodesulfobacteriota bacterium]